MFNNDGKHTQAGSWWKTAYTITTSQVLLPPATNNNQAAKQRFETYHGGLESSIQLVHTADMLFDWKIRISTNARAKNIAVTSA